MSEEAATIESPMSPNNDSLQHGLKRGIEEVYPDEPSPTITPPSTPPSEEPKEEKEYYPIFVFHLPTKKKKGEYTITVRGTDKHLGSSNVSYNLESFGQNRDKEHFMLYLRANEMEFLVQKLTSPEGLVRMTDKGSLRILEISKERSKKNASWVYKLIHLKPKGDDPNPNPDPNEKSDYRGFKMVIPRDDWYPLVDTIKNVLILVNFAQTASSPGDMRLIQKEQLFTAFFTCLAKKGQLPTIRETLIKRTSELMSVDFPTKDVEKYNQQKLAGDPLCKAMDLLFDSL